VISTLNVWNMPSPSLAIQAAVGLAAGLAAGAWHFLSLKWNWPLFSAGKIAAALGLQCARIALTCALLLLLARVGVPALLAGMAGVLSARRMIVQRHSDCKGVS
jgi:F1F0 ATPase subunit 2